MLHDIRSLARRIGPWPRRAIAAACLLLALVTSVDARAGGTRDRAESSPVVVAARALPVGHVLTAHDIAVKSWPPSVAPVGALGDLRSAVGKRLATPIGRGEPLTPTRLIGRDLVDGLATGSVAVEIGLGDPRAVDLVHSGDHVDIVATPQQQGDPGESARAQQATAVATDVVVLAVLPGDSTDTGTGMVGCDLVIAVSRLTGLRLAGYTSSQVFAVLARSP